METFIEITAITKWETYTNMTFTVKRIYIHSWLLETAPTNEITGYLNNKHTCRRVLRTFLHQQQMLFKHNKHFHWLWEGGGTWMRTYGCITAGWTGVYVGVCVYGGVVKEDQPLPSLLVLSPSPSPSLLLSSSLLMFLWLNPQAVSPEQQPAYNEELDRGVGGFLTLLWLCSEPPPPP